MWRRGHVLAVAIVLAVCAVVAAAPATAAAPPELLSVAVNATQVAVPGEVTVSYTAQVDAPISQALAGYRSTDGRTYSITLSTGATGSGTLQLPDGVANGVWTLSYVFLASSAGDAYACRDASVSPTCTQILDLSPYDLTISGSTPDRAAPTPTSVTTPSSPLQPGQPMTISWTDDEAHTLTWLSMTFRNDAPEAQGHTLGFASSDAEVLRTGQLTTTLGPDAYNGAYHLVSVFTRDNLGNTALFTADGHVAIWGGATSPTTHSLDFSTVTFTVTGSTRDVTPPRLVSLTLNNAPPTLSSPSWVDFVVSDASAPLRAFTLTFLASDGSTFVAPAIGAGGDQTPLSSFVLVQPPGLGTYRLSEISIVDWARNPIVYRRDGTTYNPLTQAVGTHSFDLSAYDLAVRPTAPRLTAAWSRPAAAGLTWDHNRSELPDLRAFRITVSPGGRVIDVPVNKANPDAGQRYTVTGLRNGVAYGFDIAAVGPGGTSDPVHATVTPMMSDHFYSPGDANRDRRDDLFAYGPSPSGSLWIYRRTWGSSYSPGTVAVQGLVARRVTAAGDMNGDKVPDHLLVTPAGYLQVLVGNGAGGVAWRATLGHGWGSVRFVTGGFDLTGDGHPDIIAVLPGGAMYLYPTVGLRLAAPRYVGGGWGGALSVFNPGDFSGDHKADLMAIDARGAMWLYRGNGRGGFLPRTSLGAGWGAYAAVFPLRDFSGTGRVDVGAVDLAGNLYRYAGTGTGQFAGRTLIGRGWQRFF